MADTQLLANTTSPQMRLKILQGIVNQLSRQERLALTDMISERNDWLSTLPVEILGEILGHLPLLFPWSTLIRVCKRWHEVFLSDELLRLSLARYWNVHDPADRAMSSDDEEGVPAKVRHIQAMRLGRPFSFGRFADGPNITRGPLLQDKNRAIALKGSHIAYITSSEEQTEVVVRDLVSGTMRSLHGTAREKIQCIALTSKILAFLSLSGRLYVYKLSDAAQPPKEVRLPSAMITAVNADEYKVAMGLCADARCTVLLYDHESGHLRSFDLPSPCPVGPGALLVDSRQRHLDLFWADSKVDDRMTKESLHVEHKRYSFDGEQLSASSWHRPALSYVSKRPFVLGDAQPTGRKGHFVFRTQLLTTLSKSETATEEPPYRAKILLCFDSNKAQLYQHPLRIYDNFFSSYSPEHVEKMDEQDFNYASLTLWKGLEFCIKDRQLTVSTINPLPQLQDLVKEEEYGDCYTVSNHFPIGPVPDRRQSKHPSGRSFSILVNDSFLVAFEQPSRRTPLSQPIWVYCFEDKLSWVGAEPTQHWDVNEEDFAVTHQHRYQHRPVRLPFQTFFTPGNVGYWDPGCLVGQPSWTNKANSPDFWNWVTKEVNYE